MKKLSGGVIRSLMSRSRGPLPRLADSGFRVFSQFEEDGLLLYLAEAFLGFKNSLELGCSI